MKNKLLRNRLIKILAKESPLTTQQIKDKLIDMDAEINNMCSKNNRVGYIIPSSNKLSQTLTKDLRFKKVGTTKGWKHSALWGLRDDKK